MDAHPSLNELLPGSSVDARRDLLRAANAAAQAGRQYFSASALLQVIAADHQSAAYSWLRDAGVTPSAVRELRATVESQAWRPALMANATPRFKVGEITATARDIAREEFGSSTFDTRHIVLAMAEPDGALGRLLGENLSEFCAQVRAGISQAQSAARTL